MGPFFLVWLLTHAPIGISLELALAESDLGSEFVSLGAIEREPGLFLYVEFFFTIGGHCYVDLT